MVSNTSKKERYIKKKKKERERERKGNIKSQGDGI